MQDIPKIVLKQLQDTAARDSRPDPHPEAELLAAFSDGLLPQSERTQVFDHLAHCSECRHILALSLPADEAAAPSKLLPPRHGWFTTPVLRWTFATAAFLALISIGVLEYEHHDRPRQAAISNPSPRQDIASPQKPSMPEAQQEARQHDARSDDTDTDAGMRKRMPSDQEDAPARQQVPSTNPQSGAASPSLKPVPTQPESDTVARNQPPDRLIRNQAPVASSLQPYGNSDVVKAKAALPSQSPQNTAGENSVPAVPPSLAIGDSPRWAIGASGSLQRSFDAGKTWEDVNVITTGKTSPKAFRAVAALAAEVWVGGSGAALYHSSDFGRQWQQILPIKAGASPAGDITQIDIFDAQNVSIATSTGETWTTSDSGQTWQKQ